MNTETNYAEHCYTGISNDIGTLRKNAADYPFSSVARFFLLYHSKKTNDPSFKQLAKQSAIYFNNIPWIQYQLAGIDQDKIVTEKTPDAKDEKITQSTLNSQAIVASETQPKAANEQVFQNPDLYIKYETKTLGFSEESQTGIQEDFYETPSVLNEQITQDPDLYVKYETETLGFSEESQFGAREDSSETSSIVNEQITQQHAGYGSENVEELISFEPLHTVDYFASQGIKISEEALESDHLGQQLKSFTAWLKSMKKLHPGQLPGQNEVIEKIIQSSAEVSNQSANVLTEAMAEVLIKQGKQEKAIEMFEKLSLMNPSKSAYFAAKIESLKTI